MGELILCDFRRQARRVRIEELIELIASRAEEIQEEYPYTAAFEMQNDMFIQEYTKEYNKLIKEESICGKWKYFK